MKKFYHLDEPDVKNIGQILAKLTEFFNPEMIRDWIEIIKASDNPGQWINAIGRYAEDYPLVSSALLMPLVPMYQNQYTHLIASSDASLYIDTKTLHENAIKILLGELSHMDAALAMRLLMDHPIYADPLVSYLQGKNNTAINDFLIPFCGEESVLLSAFANARIVQNQGHDDQSSILYLIEKIRENTTLAMSLVNKDHVIRLFEMGALRYRYQKPVTFYKKDTYMTLIRSILTHRPELYYALWDIPKLDDRQKKLLLLLGQPKDLASYLTVSNITLSAISEPDWMEAIMQHWIGKWDVLEKVLTANNLVSDNVVRLIQKGLAYKDASHILSKLSPEYSCLIFKREKCTVNSLVSAHGDYSRFRRDERKAATILGAKRLKQLQEYQELHGEVKKVWETYLGIVLDSVKGKEKEWVDADVQQHILENEIEVLF